MKSFYFLVVTIFFFPLLLLANDVDIKNTVLKADNNSYQVSIKIIVHDSPGVLRLTLTIPEEYNFNVYNNPNLLIDTRGQVVKFYANFDTENQIEINCKLSKNQSDASEASIPVHIEFSIDGVMKVLDKEIVLSENEVISNNEMESQTKRLETISKNYENKDVTALNKMKELPSRVNEDKSNSKKEELTSMPVGYNSTTKSGLSESNKSYSVQILSLQFYNEQRLNEFLNNYKLKSTDVFKKEVNGMIKIYIGKFGSYEDAKSLKEKLVQQHHLSDSFVVSY